MKDQIVQYKTAKLAKEVGFDWECQEQYLMKSDGTRATDNDLDLPFDEIDKIQYICAPTQSLLQKWLREEKKLFVLPFCNTQTGNFGVEMTDHNGEEGKYFGAGFKQPFTKNYEEALEEGLKYALEYLRTNLLT